MFDYINKKRITFTNLLNQCEETKMSLIESSLQTLIINALEELQEHHLEIARMITLGKIDDTKLESLNQKMLSIVRFLHPILDIVDQIVPDSSKFQKYITFCQEIYHNIYEKELK
mgnify:CR=1 FL=1